jgi:hypothetical protein
MIFIGLSLLANVDVEVEVDVDVDVDGCLWASGGREVDFLVRALMDRHIPDFMKLIAVSRQGALCLSGI